MRTLKLLPIVITALALGGAAFGLSQPHASNAAPVGAATNLSPYSHGCLPNGSVLTRFSWSPSGLGTQWFDISAENNNFTSNWLNAGPLEANANQVDWYQLVANTRYYVRVNTFSNTGWLPSDTVTFVTPSCAGAAEPARNLTVSSQSCLDNGSVLTRFTWSPSGDGEQWFDISALNNNFTANWLNAGPLASNDNQLDWYQLVANTRYYVRVNTFTNAGWLPSDTHTFVTPTCNAAPSITAPTNLDADTIDSDSINYEWMKGVDNLWSCVDLAETEADLNGLTGTWKNYGCGMTGDEITVDGLKCNTTYYWRVFARGSGGSSAISAVATSKTAACAP